MGHTDGRGDAHNDVRYSGQSAMCTVHKVAYSPFWQDGTEHEKFRSRS